MTFLLIFNQDCLSYRVSLLGIEGGEGILKKNRQLGIQSFDHGRDPGKGILRLTKLCLYLLE